MPFNISLCNTSHFRIKWHKYLTGHLDNGHVKSAMYQVLGRFQTNEPSTDYYGMRFRSYGLEAGVLTHPGEEQGTIFYPFAHGSRIRHSPHFENPRKINSGEGGRIEGAPGERTSLS